MKKSYIRPMAVVKSMQTETVLGALSGNSITMSADGTSGTASFNNEDAQSPAMGKVSIWDYLAE